MTVKSLLAGVLAGMICVSCGPSEPAAGQGRGKTLAGAADTTKSRGKAEGELRIPDAPIVRSPAGGAAAVTDSLAAANTSADLSDVPLAPKDAQWTIYCATVADPTHVETSRALKAALVKRTGLREWYILHENNQSRLYYGFYRSINDAGDKAETARAQGDRKKIDGIVDGDGERPFRACQFVQLSAPDPESPPEWNLVNVPADKVWTLMIGAYKDHPDRKKAAIEAVRDARARGEEAYYYHGDNVSNVFIGTWPEGAVIEERIDPDPKARRSGSGDILVLPPGMKADGNVRHKGGRAVSAVSMRLVAVDPGLKAKVQQYPNMGVNGEFLVYKSQGKTRLEGSRVIPIPRPSETLFANNAAEPADDGRGLEPQDPFSRPGVEDTAAAKSSDDAPQRRPSQKPAGTTGGPGRLRSLGK